MANRHSHKKLRAEIKARMAATGESYQTAHQRVLDGGGNLPGAAKLPGAANLPNGGSVDLVPITFFGMPGMLATFETLGRQCVMLVSSPPRAWPFPATPLFALLGAGDVQ